MYRTIPVYLVTVCRKGVYKHFYPVAKSPQRAKDFVFLKFGYGNNEIVTCRTLSYTEIKNITGAGIFSRNREG